MTDNEEIWPTFALLSVMSFVMIILGYVINPMFLTFAGAPIVLFVETLATSIGVIFFWSSGMVNVPIPPFTAGLVVFVFIGSVTGIVAVVDWLDQRGDGS